MISNILKTELGNINLLKWLNFPSQVTLQPDAFGRLQQACGIPLAGYLTTLPFRIGKVNLNCSVSWHGPAP